MRVANISFSNTIPDVKANDHGVTVDFGLVVLEMSFQEWESLQLHVSLACQQSAGKFKALQKEGG